MTIIFTGLVALVSNPVEVQVLNTYLFSLKRNSIVQITIYQITL